MRKKTTEKLNLRRGASLMIALVIFLLCALAGASAFLMASSNAGRYSHSDDQEYYTVSSAALMLIDLMDSLNYISYEVKYDYARTWDYDKDGNEHTSSDKYTLKYPTEDEPEAGNESKFSESGASTLKGSDLALCPKIKEHCDALVPYLNIPEEWYLGAKREDKPTSVETMTYKFTVTVKDDDRFSPVECTLVMGENYDLFFTFATGSGAYSITAYWVANIKVEQKTTDPEYEYAKKDETTGQYTHGSMTQKRTLKVSVRWDKENVTISRGQATENS